MNTTHEPQIPNLSTPTSAPVPGDIVALDPAHNDYLRKRAITPGLAVADGVRSVDPDRAEALLGFPLKSRVRGLAFFYPGVLPQFVRIRLDDGTYLTPIGSVVPIYFPFATDEPQEPLLIVESPAKCLALKEAGFLAIGLGGVATCLTKDGQLTESWDRVSLADRDVVLTFDNDICKPQVCSALHRLAKALTRKGAIVRYAILPETGAKLGPDDFIAAYGVLALKELVDEAGPVDSAARVEAAAKVGASAVAALLQDPVFVMGLLEGGPGVIAKCRTHFQKTKLARDFQSALTAAKEARHKAFSSGGGASQRYEFANGGLQTVDGKRLTNFVARLTREISLDDGAATTLSFLVEAELEDGSHHELTISPHEFLYTNWATERLGASAQVYPGARASEIVANAIQDLSRPVKAHAYARTGFVEVDGKPVFLMPNNSAGPTVDVQLPAGLHRYSFADASHDLRVAARLVLGMFDLGPDRIVIPLLIGAMRAPINSLLPADFVIHVYGTTGAMKSTLVALIASFFGNFTYSTLPASFSDTTSSLEFKTNVMRDVVLPVDELVVRSNSSFDEALGKAVALCRSVGNGAGKGRMRRDLTARPERPPHALVVTTGEQLPPGESVLARTLSIAVRRGDIDKTALSNVQRQPELLVSFMSAYIEWLRGRLGFIEVWATQRHAALRDKYRGEHLHLRAPATVAHLMLGAELFVNFCQHSELLSATEGDALLTRAEAALFAATAHQNDIVAQANPVHLFLKVLGELIHTGAVQLGSGGEDRTAPEWRGLIGWRRPTEILLLGEMAYGAVAKTIRERGEVMPVSAEVLWRRLRDDGHLVMDAGNKDPKRTVGGYRLRVKVLRVETLSEFLERAPVPARSPHPAGMGPQRAVPPVGSKS